MADIELVKKYLRIDGSEDDDVLALYVASADEYLANAGVKKPDPTPQEPGLYDLAIMLFVKKEMAKDDGEVRAATRSLSSIVLQLKDFGGVTE